MSLFARIAAAVCAIVVLGVLVTAALLVRASNDHLVETSLDRLESELEIQNTRLSDRVDELIRDVRVSSGTPPIQGIIRARNNGGIDPVDGSSEDEWRERLGVIFSELLRSKPTYLQVRYIGLSDGGRELVRVDRAPSSPMLRRVTGRALQRKGREPYFVATLAVEPGAIYVDDIDLNREHGKITTPSVPVLRVSTPIVDARTGETFGLVIINFDARAAFEALARVADPSHVYYIVNDDAHYLYHPDPDRAFAFEFGPAPVATREFPGLVGLLADGNVVHARVDEARRQIVAMRRLELGSPPAVEVLATVVTVDIEEITESTRESMPAIVVPLVLLAVGGLLLGLWLTRIATRPMTQLMKAMNQLDFDNRKLKLPPGLTGEARRLAETLERSLDSLRRSDQVAASNRELRQFTYIASHDLQEPVRTITSFATLLEEDYGSKLDEDGRTSLRFISESCQRMQALIEGLLDHSRIGTGSVRRPIDIDELLEDVQQDLSRAIEASGATIEVGPMPRMNVYPVEVRLLFQNLLSNAIKFHRPGVPPRVTIEARAERDGWTFSVTDEGPGIPAEHRKKIFMIFQRLHTRTEFEGAGIGLAHCRKIVEMHHGRIWVEDAPGGGARFVFQLEEI